MFPLDAAPTMPDNSGAMQDAVLLARHRQHVVDLIMGYLDDTLVPAERRAFEAHIADRRNRWRFPHGYRETVALGQRLRDDDVPGEVRERLETFLRNRGQRPL